MSTNDKTNKPRLKNIDDLFLLDGTEMSNAKNAITSVDINTLTPFKGHPFRLYEGERLADMVDSVKANGVLVPIIVRKVEDTLEILAGHNRVNAAKAAGLTEIPTIILENVSDEEAMVYVVETNLLQRSFSDMTHSEKAAVIALHHSKMFSQGKRNDILEQLKMLENPHEYGENATLPQVGTKLRTDAKIGVEYGLSKNTVARYLRVNQLIPALKTRLDDGNIAFIPAVTLSYLKESEQELVDSCIGEYGFAVGLKRADTLRELSGKLNSDSVYQILSGESVIKPSRTPAVKINKAVYAKYFKPNQSAKEVQKVVENALEMYFGGKENV